MIRVRRAILSVSDKRGIAALGRALARLGVEIYSTGGTYRTLRAAAVKCRLMESLTGFPEILGGRVKSLHPKIHGGVLMRRTRTADVREARAHGIRPIDLVCVNLYPFERVAGKKGVSRSRVLEEIDIGGPTLLRAAAKNYPHVLAVCDPDDYPRVIRCLQKGKGRVDERLSRELAHKVFQQSTAYDEGIASYFAEDGAKAGRALLPDSLCLRLRKIQTLRYGENPHQQAALYRSLSGREVALEQLHGKELSYNNYLDVEAARDLVEDFPTPAAAVVKHQNPCGVATGAPLEEALRAAVACDSSAAFGGVVGVNRAVDRAFARALLEELTYFEVIVAPDYAPGAISALRSRKNLRILRLPRGPRDLRNTPAPSLSLRSSEFGFVAQERDRVRLSPGSRWKVVTRVRPSAQMLRALAFAWTCAKHVRSNAIVLARASSARGHGILATVGIGAGQMSRVDAVRLACQKAGARAARSVAASDGFFPMPDNVEVAHRHGILAIVQPGGSIRDADIVAEANRSRIAMVFTGERHFRH